MEQELDIFFNQNKIKIRDKLYNLPLLDKVDYVKNYPLQELNKYFQEMIEQVNKVLSQLKTKNNKNKSSYPKPTLVLEDSSKESDIINIIFGKENIVTYWFLWLVFKKFWQQNNLDLKELDKEAKSFQSNIIDQLVKSEYGKTLLKPLQNYYFKKRRL